jgi:hypothetical protein
LKTNLSALAPLLLLVLAAAAGAQELPDYSGKWTSVTRSDQTVGRCGRLHALAELEVVGRVPDTKHPTYEGKAKVWLTSDRCGMMGADTSNARLVVRGTRVSLSYDNEEWGSEMLVREGNLLSGIDSSGEPLEWHQPAELPVHLNSNMVQQNIITELTRSESENFRNELVAGGVDAAKAAELAPEIVARLAQCIVEVSQFQAAIQRLPYGEILKMIDPISSDEPNSRVVRRFDTTSSEVRTEVCVHKASVELGIDEPL